MPDPGQVYHLPPETREGPDKGDRPHLVLSLCTRDSEVATFAYGSTKATDAAHGAAHVVVDPFATAYRGTGLTQPTYFYPSRLLTFAIADLPQPSGRIIDELPAIRQQLRIALGLGRGVTEERNRRGANRRGRLAEYAPWIAEELGTSRCVVITEPDYSRASLQQITIPILDPAKYEAVPGDIILHRRDWLSAGPPGTQPLILAVPLITSVYERDSLGRYGQWVVSESAMREVEIALALHFGL
jgi:hypothetical protein